jgi:lipoprotein-anchoring transpeptidase ErfK/SrfK
MSMNQPERSKWRPWRRVMLSVLLFGAVLAPVPAVANEFAPPDEPYLAFDSGIGAGATLAGHTLPMDWSQRESPCDPGDSRYALQVRVAPSMHPALCPGDVSEGVIHLQQLLTEKKLYREAITGIYDKPTVYAVATFHKLIGPSHSNPKTARLEWIGDPPPEDWTELDWDLLEAFDPQPPKYRDDQPDRVEVDIGHQVLYLIEGDEVAAIMPVSTGSGTGTKGCRVVGCRTVVTPRTDRMDGGSVFYQQHNYGAGWSPLPGGWSIYKAIFYRGNYGEWNYGIHGYRRVPHYPDSHGCVRLTVWDMDFLRPDDGSNKWGSYILDSRVTVGMLVHVWDA